MEKKKIEEALSNLYKDSRFGDCLDIKHYEWEENGEKFSSWKIGNGIHTGDGGMIEFQRIFQEELAKLIK